MHLYVINIRITILDINIVQSFDTKTLSKDDE